jgi:hypothetical protein
MVSNNSNQNIISRNNSSENNSSSLGFAIVKGTKNGAYGFVNIPITSPTVPQILPWGTIVSPGNNVALDGNTIRIVEAGWYSVEFVGLAEVDVTSTINPVMPNIPALTLNFIFNPVHGTFTDLTQQTIYLGQIAGAGEEVSSRQHFSSNFQTIFYASESSIFQLETSMAVALDITNHHAYTATPGGLVGLNGNYTLFINKIG